MDTHRRRAPGGQKNSNEGRNFAVIATLILITLGLWLVVSPLPLSYQGTRASRFSVFWGFCTIGFALLLLLFSKFKYLSWMVAGSGLLAAVTRWVVVGIGVFLTFSPLFIPHQDPTSHANHLISGLMITAFALLSNQELRFQQEHKIHTT